MGSSAMADLDLIDELRLRRWARENYVAKEQRQLSWHPVVLEEMNRKEKDNVVISSPLLTASEA